MTIEFERQLDRLEGHLQQDPANPHLLAELIDTSLACGQVDRARRHADAALAAHPSEPALLARAGNVLLAQQQWTQAEALFAPLADAQADIHLAYNLAYARLWLGRHADAWQAMAPFSASAALWPAAVTLMVRVLHHTGQFDQALALIDAQEAAGITDATLLAAASVLLLDAGQAERAERFSVQAMRAGAPPLEALVVAGSLALGRVDSDGAIAHFNAALALRPDEGRSWSGLGMASLLKQDLHAAAVQLDQATRLLPNHIGTLHALGWCHLFSRQLDAAHVAFHRALELDRNFGESHGGLAVVQAVQGARAEAAASIERALRLDAGSLSARYAQMVLDGDVADPARFRALVQRLLASRQGLFGASLADMVQQYDAH